MAVYPPYQHALLDRTQHVTPPWHQFFLSLTGADGGTLTNGSVTFVKLEPIASPQLLGRGSPGVGSVEVITLGTGLTMTGTTLSATGGGGSGADGYWTPITDGVTPIAELLFDSHGDCIVGFVPTP